jgi:hypothetical protein
MDPDPDPAIFVKTPTIDYFSAYYGTVHFEGTYYCIIFQNYKVTNSRKIKVFLNIFAC